MSRLEKALEKAVKARNIVALQNETDSPSGQRECASGENALGEQSVPRSPYVVTLREPCSPVSEEYRKLKSMVVQRTNRDRFLNMLMVTSAVSSEGKSITAVNLAVTLAQEYNRTALLIDADMRRPSLHELLDASPNIGLSDCLAKGIDVGDAVMKTAIPALSFLGAGTHAQDPVELVSSARMKDLMKEVKQRYNDRYIIIDTPPLLPYAETHVLSSLVDGILFVVKEGRTTVKSVSDALELLNGTNVLGFVYNNISVEAFSSRYYYYYQSPYGKPKKGN